MLLFKHMKTWQYIECTFVIFMYQNLSNIIMIMTIDEYIMKIWMIEWDNSLNKIDDKLYKQSKIHATIKKKRDLINPQQWTTVDQEQTLSHWLQLLRPRNVYQLKNGRFSVFHFWILYPVVQFRLLLRLLATELLLQVVLLLLAQAQRLESVAVIKLQTIGWNNISHSRLHTSSPRCVRKR